MRATAVQGCTFWNDVKGITVAYNLFVKNWRRTGKKRRQEHCGNIFSVCTYNLKLSAQHNLSCEQTILPPWIQILGQDTGFCPVSYVLGWVRFQIFQGKQDRHSNIKERMKESEGKFFFVSDYRPICQCYKTTRVIFGSTL